VLSHGRDVGAGAPAMVHGGRRGLAGASTAGLASETTSGSERVSMACLLYVHRRNRPGQSC
jgi:hypothetical protein